MRRRPDFTHVKCCVCETDKVKIYKDRPDWRRYYGENDDKDWDGISYVCKSCYEKIRRRTILLYYGKTARHRPDFTHVKCCVCGTDKVKIYNDRPDWCRYYGENYDKDWDGISYTCKSCKNKIVNRLPDSGNNIIKSLRDCRTGNQNPNSSNAKADKSQALACKLYGWIDLNKENDNHNYPLDCYDPKTELYHQIRGRYYTIDSNWPFIRFERELSKIFEDMICFCFSKDGKIVERIYKFPEKIVKNRSGATIVKNPSKGGWYEKYRVKDEDELKNANDIWKDIIVEAMKRLKVC